MICIMITVGYEFDKLKCSLTIILTVNAFLYLEFFVIHTPEKNLKVDYKIFLDRCICLISVIAIKN